MASPAVHGDNITYSVPPFIWTNKMGAGFNGSPRLPGPRAGAMPGATGWELASRVRSGDSASGRGTWNSADGVTCLDLTSAGKEWWPLLLRWRGPKEHRLRLKISPVQGDLLPQGLSSGISCCHHIPWLWSLLPPPSTLRLHTHVQVWEMPWKEGRRMRPHLPCFLSASPLF